MSVELLDTEAESDYIVEWYVTPPDHAGDIIIQQDRWKRPYGDKPARRVILKWKWAK